MPKPDRTQIAAAWASRGFGSDLWTDAPGQTWEDFRHANDELVNVLEGVMEFEIAGEIPSAARRRDADPRGHDPLGQEHRYDDGGMAVRLQASLPAGVALACPRREHNYLADRTRPTKLARLVACCFSCWPLCAVFVLRSGGRSRPSKEAEGWPVAAGKHGAKP